jgi:hypothetical protein
MEDKRRSAAGSKKVSKRFNERKNAVSIYRVEKAKQT